MLGRSFTFGSKYVEKRPQQENFFELRTPNGKPDKIDRIRKEREKLWIARYDATEFGANIKE